MATKNMTGGTKSQVGNVARQPAVKGNTGAGTGGAGPSRGMPSTSKTTKPPTRK